MKKIKKLIIKLLHNEVILYLIFGVLTTIINILTYYIGFNYIFKGIANFEYRTFIANLIAFIIAVLFAFITNKKYVFNSKTTSKKEKTKEMISFFIARIITYFIDSITILYLSSWLLNIYSEKISSLIAKIVSNVIVIILNYIFSKFIVFKKKTETV